MTLKTKISAAAKDCADKYAGYDNTNSRDWHNSQIHFRAGSNFALGEVRELLLECRAALDKIKEECLDEKQVIDVIDDVHSTAINALKKIDDSGVLTDETIKPITKENE